MQKIIFIALFFFQSMQSLHFEKIDETAKSMIAQDNYSALKTYCCCFNQHDLFLHAASKQAFHCAQILLKNESVRIDGDGFAIERNPLYIALIHEDFPFADFLASKGANVNTQCHCTGDKHPGCKSILHHLIVDQNSVRNILSIRWLLEHGADQSSFNFREQEGYVKAAREELKKFIKIKIS